MGIAFGLRLSLIAFSLECLNGLLENAPFDEAIQSAFLVGGIAGALGWILGELARHVVEEHVKAKLANADSAEKTQSSTSNQQ